MGPEYKPARDHMRLSHSSTNPQQKGKGGAGFDGHKPAGSTIVIELLGTLPPRPMGIFALGRKHGKRRRRCRQDIAHATVPLRSSESALSAVKWVASRLRPRPIIFYTGINRFRPRLVRLERLCVHVLCSCAGHWRYVFLLVLPVCYRVFLCVLP